MSVLYLAQRAEVGSSPNFELISLFQLLLGTACVEVRGGKIYLLSYAWRSLSLGNTQEGLLPLTAVVGEKSEMKGLPGELRKVRKG